MTLIVPEGDQASSEDILSGAEDVFRAAEKLIEARIEDLKIQPDSPELKRDIQRYRDTLQLFLKERQAVEDRKRKQSGIGGGGYALDLDAARAEVGRRLACLGDTRGTGSVS